MKDVCNLKAAWDEYGHMVKFDDLHAVKMDRGCYAVVCWRNGDKLTLADLARASEDHPWEVQNDEYFPDITVGEWQKLQIVPECDWFCIPGHEIYKGL